MYPVASNTQDVSAEARSASHEDGALLAIAATDLLTSATGGPEQRIRSMLQAFVKAWERHRHLFHAMLEARAGSSVVREMSDSDRESFIPAVAAIIDSERSAGRAPGGPPTRVLASVLLELRDRLLG
ncbi:MAG TPA: hypothetical protein VMU34_22985 [Mycobacterium sp.]|nr:hypothetical protein [Mycobacterium sp.]